MQAEEVQDSKYTLAIQLSASKLDKKDLFGKVFSFSAQRNAHGLLAGVPILF